VVACDVPLLPPLLFGVLPLLGARLVVVPLVELRGA
jgi:hypothetical protein